MTVVKNKWMAMKKSRGSAVKMFCMHTTFAMTGKDNPLPNLRLRISIRPYGHLQMYTSIKAPKGSVSDGRVQVPPGDEYMAAIRKDCDNLEIKAHRAFMALKTESYCPTPREVADKLKSMDSQVSIANSFDKCVEEFRDSMRVEWTENTYKMMDNAMAALKRFMKSELHQEELLLHELNFKFLTRFQLWLRRCGNKDGKPLAQDSVRQYLIKITQVLDFAFMNDYISVNPCDKFNIMQPKAENAPDQLDRKVSVVSQTLIESTAIVDERLERTRLLMVLQTWTGLSYEDLCQNSIKNIIHTSLSSNNVKEIRYNRVKTGELAIVPLFEETKAVLEKLGWDNNPGNYRNYLRAVQAVWAHFSIPMEDKDGTHVPRHLFGNRMLEKGFSMESVSRMMGHSSIRITESVYAKINSDKIQADYMYVQKRATI